MAGGADRLGVAEEDVGGDFGGEGDNFASRWMWKAELDGVQE